MKVKKINVAQISVLLYLVISALSAFGESSLHPETTAGLNFYLPAKKMETTNEMTFYCSWRSGK